jgi:hypothetical protein
MVVVAQGHAEDFLGLLLFDDEPVQVGLDLARLLVEGKILAGRRLIGGLGRAGQVGLAGAALARCWRINSCNWR